MDVAALFFIRLTFVVLLFFVVAAALVMLFKKSHGRAVLAQLINTINGDRIDITSWESAIGRAKSCDVILNYSAVSRFHAVLARRNKGWMIFDTFSKTGLQVNGSIIKKQSYIYDGDLITIGNVVMCFRSPLFRRKKDQRIREGAKTVDINELDERDISSVYAEVPSSIEIEYISALINQDDESLVLLFLEEYSIGRASSNDISLPVMTVSRKHAILSKGEKGWYIQDTESKTGIKLNNRKIKASVYLRDNDIIDIGGVQFRFIENYMRE